MTPAQFLSAITDGGPVNICSIVPDGELDGYIIRVDQQLARIEGWVEAKGGTAGLYYSLNEPLPDLVGKRDRLKIGEADVAAFRGIVLDIDPRPEEEAKPGGLERERARIRAIADKMLSPDSPAPATFCVDSGGGFQIGWMFPEPLPATPETREAVKAQGRGLGAELGGDNTFSVDHLFRLPGTINHPNAKKRSLGRTDAPALVVSMDTTRRYRLEDLAKIAPPVAPKAKVDATLPEIDYGTVLDVAQLGDAAMPENLRTYKEMLRQWRRFDTVMDGPDRSKRDIALTSECIRLGLSDPTDIACVVFSVAPEKLLEEEDNNRGERYARRMLADRLAKVKGPGAVFGETDATAEHNEGAAEKPRLRFELLSDRQLQSMPDPRWLVGRHLPEEGIGILYGRPNTGKSFIILDMALTIAVGKTDWHGDTVASNRGGVLYIAGEGSADLKLRVRAWKKQNWIEDEMIPEDRFRVLVQPMNFMRKEDIADLLAAVSAAAMGKLSLIVVDTVSRAAAGADENSQQDMSIFVQALDALRVKTGAFVEGIHHESKGGMMRGSTVLAGAADVIHHFERKEHQPYGRLTCVKMKAGPDNTKDSYRLDVIGLGNELSSLVPVRVEEKEAEEAMCTDEMKAEIFAAITCDALAANHWSMAAQSKSAGRKYAPEEVSRGWGVPLEVASQWLALWLNGPYPGLRDGVVNSNSKRRGLTVLDTPIMDGVFG